MNRLFNDKKFKYGTYSTAITVIVIAVLIAINLVAGEFDYKFDLSEDSVFSLSDETKEILKNTDADINIYTLFSSKDSDTIISRTEQILDQYRLIDRNINIENKDLYLYPDFAGKYANEDTSVDRNSIIVESGDKYRVIAYSDYYDGRGNFNIEENITSAIQYVTSENSAVIYFTTGHGEIDYENFTALTKQLKLNNYTAASLNLLDGDIPQDCTMLFVTSGKKDFSAEEAQKIKDYLTNDGRAVFMLTNVTKELYPNLCSVIAEYGVEPVGGYVMESSESNYMMYPVAVMPSVAEHEITKSVKDNGYSILAYMSQALKETEVKKQGLVIEPLLTTADSSFVKQGDPQTMSMNKESGDIEGPFDLAYAVTYSTYTDTSHTTKVVISGNYYMLSGDVDNLVNGSGSNFIMNAVKWLDEGAEPISIKSKSISSEALVIAEGEKTKIQIISWGIIPGVLFLCGFAVWIRRRNG